MRITKIKLLPLTMNEDEIAAFAQFLRESTKKQPVKKESFWAKSSTRVAAGLLLFATAVTSIAFFEDLPSQ